MKARKVHKRLTKLDELLADLTEGYSKGALHVRAALEGAKVAVAHLKTTLSSEASSGAAKKSEASSAVAPKSAKRKLSAAHKRAIREGIRRRAAEKKAASPPASKKRATRKTA